MGRLDHFQDLLLMAGCLLITLRLEFVLGARVYGRAAGLAFAIISLLHIYGEASRNLWAVSMRSRHRVVKGFSNFHRASRLVVRG